MDERPGRRIAEYMEIEVTGTVALLVKLAQSRKVNIKEELDNLIRNDFWLSKKLYNWALDSGDIIKNKII
jgi:predicted nucleic acid-binding protein